MHTQSNQKSRIIDIALQAGVSTATVDRVLNGRGGVRGSTEQKVQAAIRTLQGALSRPQIIPSVASNGEIDVVMAGGSGFANETVARELLKIARDRSVRLRSTYPRKLDPHALVEALRVRREEGSSGIIVQALDHPLVRQEIAAIHVAGIPVISLLTRLPGVETLGYVGLDNEAAGRSAGLLMNRLIREPGGVAVFACGPIYHSHEQREGGFRKILRQEREDLTLLPQFESRDDPDRSYRMARNLLASKPDLKGLLNIGSGNRGIEKALLESGRQHEIIYICFNLTPLTRQALQSGVLDAVVHQDMGRAAHGAINAMINHISGRPCSFPPVPVEIIMRENLR